jgi:hypothetical protein
MPGKRKRAKEVTVDTNVTEALIVASRFVRQSSADEAWESLANALIAPLGLNVAPEERESFCQQAANAIREEWRSDSDRSLWNLVTIVHTTWLRMYP